VELIVLGESKGNSAAATVALCVDKPSAAASNIKAQHGLGRVAPQEACELPTAQDVQKLLAAVTARQGRCIK
jgi:hypothetical protein